MKIGLFGDCNSIWVLSYVKEVLLRIDDCKVFIFSDKKLDINDYDELDNVHVVECGAGNNSKKSRLGAIAYIFDVFRNVVREKNFDCFHIHYVIKRRLFVTYLLRKYTKKTVATFWGSDLLRIEQSELETYSKYLHNVNEVTVGSEYMMKYIEKTFAKEIADKTTVVRFGVKGLEAINKFKLSKKEAKQRIGFPENKTLIGIGYNGSRGQNHISVIKELSKLPEELKNKVFIVFPMSYGLEEEYLRMIEKEVDEVGCDYKYMLDYMDSDTIANLCFATDIFVHAQETDAFSASVQEYIGAGVLVYNPTWIVYEELDNNDAYYIRYESFGDLRNKLIEYLSNDNHVGDVKRLNNNKMIMYNLSSWSVLAIKWLKLYENSM